LQDIREIQVSVKLRRAGISQIDNIVLAFGAFTRSIGMYSLNQSCRVCGSNYLQIQIIRRFAQFRDKNANSMRMETSIEFVNDKKASMIIGPKVSLDSTK